MDKFIFDILTPAIDVRRAYELMGYLCGEMFAYLGTKCVMPRVSVRGDKAFIAFSAPELQFASLKLMAMDAIRKYEEKYPVEKPA